MHFEEEKIIKSQIICRGRENWSMCEKSRHVPPLKGLNKENLGDIGKVNKLSILMLAQEKTQGKYFMKFKN